MEKKKKKERRKIKKPYFSKVPSEYFYSKMEKTKKVMEYWEEG